MDTARVFQSVDASLSHNRSYHSAACRARLAPVLFRGLIKLSFAPEQQKIVRLPFVIASRNAVVVSTFIPHTGTFADVLVLQAPGNTSGALAHNAYTPLPAARHPIAFDRIGKAVPATRRALGL